jgi:hypothetical protein
MISTRVRAAAGAASVLVLLLISPLVESARPIAGQLPIDATGAIDYAKLARVRRNSRFRGTTSELAQHLVQNADLVSGRVMYISNLIVPLAAHG